MDYQDINVTVDGYCGTIAIDRPKVLNAIRYQTMVEISGALKKLETDDSVRVIIITGAGDKAFIAGGDISLMAETQGYLQHMIEVPKGQDICTEIENFPKPVIARINGVALGGGTEIALCCDIRVAADTAVLGVPEIKLGIIPGYGGTQRLPRLIGMGRAKEMVLIGDHITAEEACRIGLVNRVAPKAELDNAVQKLAEKLAARGPVALRLAKTAMNNGIQADLRTGLSIEANCFALCFGTEDRIEGTKAFMEKRKPNFAGR